jgi:hypothetical protein
MFEAGAISHAAENHLVYPYLFDLEESAIPGPLAQFQATKANEIDTFELISSINLALNENAVPQDRLEKTFKKLWPQLENNLEEIPASPEQAGRIVLNDDKLRNVIRMHQASIAFKMSEVIDSALLRLETFSGSFDSDGFFDEIYGAVLEGRSLCQGFSNDKTGDLKAYFAATFNETDLRGFAKDVETLLLNETISPIDKRTRVFKKIRAVQEQVFARLKI